MEAAVPTTGPGLDPEIHANPMKCEHILGETNTIQTESHLCGYFLQIQLQT